MKAQVERHENLSLKQENDNLRIENLALKEALKNLICGKCGGQQLLAEISTEEKHLRIENAVLKDELDRARAWTNKIVRPLSSFGGTSSPPMLNTNLEVAARRNGLGSLGNVHTALSIGLNPNNAVSDSWGDGPMSRPLIGMHPVNPSFQDSMFFELASTATDEIIKLAENDTRLWFRSLAGSGERLNFDEYMKVITPCVDITSRACIDGTRATSLLAIRSTDLVEVLMNADQWAEMFSEMIGSSSTLEVISGGINGTKNCALQLMQAEIQVISPLVPVRQMRFLRFCRQHVNGAWVVVDVSIDNISEGVGSQTFSPCRRLPSGCILQDMPNGCSKQNYGRKFEPSTIIYCLVVGGGDDSATFIT
ncbi:homeobox-leucine zipper protein HDG1 [Daucus carota subsp. sativus]|uniref:homeobox-leucine zipper protein HDG1 n=1 Tax=Daucus carota subsp. sativus TaxID=79200 RepID=UPI003082C505